MVRPMPLVHVGENFSPILLAIGLFVSVSLLVSLCAKHARRVPIKHACKASDPNAAKGPLPSPKQVITTISQKAMSPLVHAKKATGQGTDPTVGKNCKGSHEESGLWQKAILMGEKCQPPEFSGVIYYDYSGNRIPEMPKSPRHSAMTPLRNLTFPVEKK